MGALRTAAVISDEKLQMVRSSTECIVVEMYRSVIWLLDTIKLLLFVFHLLPQQLMRKGTQQTAFTLRLVFVFALLVLCYGHPHKTVLLLHLAVFCCHVRNWT